MAVNNFDIYKEDNQIDTQIKPAKNYAIDQTNEPVKQEETK